MIEALIALVGAVVLLCVLAGYLIWAMLEMDARNRRERAEAHAKLIALCEPGALAAVDAGMRIVRPPDGEGVGVEYIDEQREFQLQRTVSDDG